MTYLVRDIIKLQVAFPRIAATERLIEACVCVRDAGKLKNLQLHAETDSDPFGVAAKKHQQLQGL